MQHEWTSVPRRHGVDHRDHATHDQRQGYLSTSDMIKELRKSRTALWDRCRMIYSRRQDALSKGRELLAAHLWEMELQVREAILQNTEALKRFK